MNHFKDSAALKAGKRYLQPVKKYISRKVRRLETLPRNQIEPNRYGPEPVVGALVFNKKGEIILINSPKFSGKYIVPGGHIEIGETMESALVREFKEETNLDITDIEFLMVQDGNDVQRESFHEGGRHFIFLDFVARARKGDVVLEKREADKFVWVKPKDALSLDINNSTRVFIEKYLGR